MTAFKLQRTILFFKITTSDAVMMEDVWVRAYDGYGNIGETLAVPTDNLLDIIGRGLGRTALLVGPYAGYYSGGWAAFAEMLQAMAALRYLGELYDAAGEIWDIIVEDGIVAAIREIVDGLKSHVAAQMEEDNPFDEGTSDYNSFKDKWYIGYIAGMIVMIVIGIGVASAIAEFLANLVDAIRLLAFGARTVVVIENIMATTTMSQVIIHATMVMAGRILLITAALEAGRYLAGKWPALYGSFLRNLFQGAFVLITLNDVTGGVIGDYVTGFVNKAVRKGFLHNKNQAALYLARRYHKEVGMIDDPTNEHYVAGYISSGDIDFKYGAGPDDYIEGFAVIKRGNVDGTHGYGLRKTIAVHGGNLEQDGLNQWLYNSHRLNGGMRELTGINLETGLPLNEELLARRIRQAMNPVEGNPSAVCIICQSRFDTDDYIYQSGNLVIVFNHEGSFQKARLEWQPHHGV